MTDRRRINAPAGGTAPLIFARTVKEPEYLQSLRPTRNRGPDELRKIFLKSTLIPSASGSSYLEIPFPSPTQPPSLIPPRSSLKLTCAVHGPRPLPRSAPFSPHLLLTTTVKFAPFASRTRRGYIRDAVERDLGVHLETALRGVIIGERWPKSGVDVVVTVVEGDEDGWWGDSSGDVPGMGKGGSAGGGWGLLNILAGCITVASAAIADAGIDCVDLVSGGVAALVRDPGNAKEEKVVSVAALPMKGKGGKEEAVVSVLDPCPAEHQEIVAACVVGYLAGRDEITELWLKGEVAAETEELVDRAVQAAAASLSVLKEAVKEAAELKFRDEIPAPTGKDAVSQGDVEMVG